MAPRITVTLDYDVASDGRPKGPGYVRYEDLYRVGDTVTAAMARMTEPAIITFPAGRFEQADFSIGDTYAYCIYVPKLCKGLWGSGMGALGEDSGTIFTMKPNTSTKKGATQGTGADGTLCLLYHSSNYAPTYRDFHVEGTDQGGDAVCYSAFGIFNPGGPANVKNLLVTGWEGNNGAPPGETFGLSMHGSNNHVVENYTGDGRRAVGGPAYGAVAATAANCVGGTWTDCHVQHCRASQFVGYQAFNVHTFNLMVTRDIGARWLGSASGVNHERTAGFVHHSPVFDLGPTRNKGVHMTHSNDGWSATYDGTRRTVADGSLTVYTPTFNPIWPDGRFYIETWTPYFTGDTMSTPPVLTGAPGKWVHGPTRINIGG